MDDKWLNLINNRSKFNKVKENLKKSQIEWDTKGFLKNLENDELQDLKIYVDGDPERFKALQKLITEIEKEKKVSLNGGYKKSKRRKSKRRKTRRRNK